VNPVIGAIAGGGGFFIGTTAGIYNGISEGLKGGILERFSCRGNIWTYVGSRSSLWSRKSSSGYP
jgi:hypothetical protein